MLKLSTKFFETSGNNGISFINTIQNYAKSLLSGEKEFKRKDIEKLINFIKNNQNIRNESKKTLILKNLYDQLNIKNNSYKINQIGNKNFNFNNKIIYNPGIKSEYIDGYFGMEDATGNQAIIDFANDEFGGGVLRNGFVQEEKMLLETNLLGEAEKYSELTEKPLYINGKSTHKFIGDGNKIYGNNLKDYRINKNNVDNFLQKRNIPLDINIIAMAAIEMKGRKNGKKFEYGKYYKANLEQMFKTAYNGFLEHKKQGGNIIHTGPWGAGAFGNSENVTCVIQILAAQAVGIKLKYHNKDNKDKKGFSAYNSAIRFLKENSGKKYNEIFEELIKRGHLNNPNSRFWAPNKN